MDIDITIFSIGTLDIGDVIQWGVVLLAVYLARRPHRPPRSNNPPDPPPTLPRNER